MNRFILCFLVASLGLSLTPVVMAAITAEQRKEIAEIKKELGKVQGLITKKEFDEARQILDSSKEKLEAIVSEAMVTAADRTLAPTFKLIEQKRALLDKKSAGPGGDAVDFEKSVAPILAAKCMNCHNEDRSSGGLRLDNFAGIEAGGTNKQLVVAGQPARSLLVARLTAAGNLRMPKAPQAPLSKDEITTIASWVNQGAKFVGDKTKRFSTMAGSSGSGNNLPPPTIPRATGDEKVSFTKDIAPFMVNLCVGCHSGTNPRGGLSLVSFESMMRGGNSGRVILPGNREGSRLFRLVGGLENPRMPQGQARITRKNYEDLITWFEEGNKFDGPDPKRPLREYVPTAEQLEAERLAKLTPEEFHQIRKEKSEEQWKLANPKEEFKSLESDQYLVIGNATEERLKEVLAWADEHAKTLRTAFSIKETEIWKGKLTIFVFKDRFSFEEFPRVVESAEIPQETIGLSRVTAGFDEAYVCVEDVGDEVTAESPGLKLSVIDQITGAYLKRSGDKIPDWLIRGLGLALAARDDKKNEFMAGLPGQAVEALNTLTAPEQLFEKGHFSSADLGPVGFTLVQYMLTAGGPAKLGQFMERLKSGADLNEATTSVYNLTPQKLALAYRAAMGNRKPAKIKKR